MADGVDLVVMMITAVVAFVSGMMMYRTLFWVDRRDLLDQVGRLKSVNESLLEHIVALEGELRGLRDRMALVEATNRELNILLRRSEGSLDVRMTHLQDGVDQVSGEVGEIRRNQPERR